MEKKIGKNVSSGAKKVERIEKEKEISAATVDSATEKTPVKKTTKTTKTTTKKASKSPEKREKVRAAKAEKKEDAAAEKRLDAAKKRARKKEEKLMKKAELKQKKLEKKAALKEKKLARKEMIAKKRAERKALVLKKNAERKQKHADKKLAIKEKKLERRAEKNARREMLKNESKAEKQKRLSREKKDRIALKRQRREARDKAREQKIKAREAAHARKADDKKHKREQRTERKKRTAGFGGWLAAVISLGVACLALATVVTAGGMRMNDMNVAAENGARATLYEMVSVSEDMDNNLSKLRVSSGRGEQRKLLTDILVDSMLMESALERIPVDAATSTDISAFVNKTGSYARTLLGKLAAGKSLTETEKNTISYLANVNEKLYGELNALATTMTDKQLREFMRGGKGTVSDKFGEIGGGTKVQPDEIVDAPFSGEGNVGENELSKLETVTEARAEELVKEYLNGYHLRKVCYTGETVARDISCYNFVMTDENDVEIFAQISKNGGKLVFFDTYEPCTQKNFDLDTCDTLAKEFLSSLGIDNVEAVWLSDAGMVADITYVSYQDGVRAYPDMIRVRVCESKGRVVGMDAKGYLVNNCERYYAVGLSEWDAREMISSDLEIENTGLALIPLDGEEVLAYEFFCKAGEREYVIYLNANNGEEVQIFRVRDSAAGSYLR
jgi:germination protein YpeB